MTQAPRTRVIHILREFSIPLILGVVTAVAWENLDPHSLHALIHTPIPGLGAHMNLHFLTNDILMAVFFGLAAKEITESCLPGGAMSSPRTVVNPIFATVFGILGPVGVFFGWVWFSGDSSIVNGWAIPTATDIAMGWLVARVIFGPLHPAVQFLVLVAVLDDGIGLAIIAVFYPDPVHPVQPAMLAVVAAAIAGAWGLRRAGVQSFWPYLLGPGVASWAGFMLAHLHPALALVPIVPFMPHRHKDEGLYIERGAHLPHRDALNRFEHTFQAPVDFGLFAFGLANAGVAFSAVGSATTAVLLGLVVGKTFGILGGGLLARALGFPLPKGISVSALLVIGMIAGIGLTVALFVAGAAFTDPALQGAAKMGALASVAIAPVAILVGRLLGVRGATESEAPSEEREPSHAPA